MANELYAWSTIRTGKSDPNDASKNTTKVINPGDTVTQGDLELDDEQFAQLVESGAVRTMEFPDMPDTYQDSPINFFREQARNAAEGALVDAQNSEDNMSAILAANAAATGSSTPTLDPDIQATMEEQIAADSGGGGAKPDPKGGTGTTQVSPNS